ncbi:caspase family protein [Nocardia sp. NPDC057668]|uniref:caspase, EACC1-associated type n=1 Tax=Nocardia sp. NPDC057668 TaxID=3346202 RepID=UPI00366E331F
MIRLPDSARSRAVLVGTENYSADSGFATTTQVGRNLVQLSSFLRSQTGLQHVEVVHDPRDGGDFASALNRAVDEAEDLLLFYFAGHGVVGGGELQLTHTGSRHHLGAYTTVSYGLIRDHMRRATAAIRIVILDCCQSGTAHNSGVLSAADDGAMLEELAEVEGTYVLTATGTASGNRLAFTDGPQGCTLFTGTLLDILQSGHRTAGQYLTMDTLFPILESALRRAGGPRPKSSGRNTAASLALTRNQQWRRATTEPSYLMVVRELAPSVELLGRDSELDELERFCWGEEEYVWWQAGPWAGKSALMTSFVLQSNQNMDVVSFFITARFAGQSDHAAFTDALIEQLSSLLPDEEIPAPTTISTRDSLRRRLLISASDAAASAGRRLVLVIDGLDEDTGDPSIASLLPRSPHPALRVIVAGRSNPPVPLDVPEDHPLRRCRIRVLVPSAAARDIKRSATLELRRLLRGGRDEQHVVGLLAAALGGLTAGDLEELTQLPPYRIDDFLTGVSGRTFQTRSQREAGKISYLFAHETLQQVAENTLGNRRLCALREELHDWVVGYRRRGWPDHTPEYLTHGYARMLRSTGEIEQLIELGLDPARQALLLRRTGGEVAVLREIRWAAELELTTGKPDLLRMATLAHERAVLTFHGSLLPVELVGVWAGLGDWRRAEAIALGRESDAQDEALALLVRGLFAAGRFDRAIELVAGYAALPQQDLTTEQMAIGLARAGRIDSAIDFADQISRSYRGRVNLEIVFALVAEGTYGRAEEFAERIHQHDLRQTAFRSIVQQVMTADGISAVVELIRTDAYALVRLPDFLFVVIDEMVEVGRIDAIEKVVERVIKPLGLVLVEATIACALLRRGIGAGYEMLDRAWTLAHDTNSQHASHIRPVLGLACALGGQIDRAHTLADRMELDSEFAVYGLAMVQAAIDCGWYEDALRWTQLLYSGQRAEAVAIVARALFYGGDDPDSILARFQSVQIGDLVDDGPIVLQAVLQAAVELGSLDYVVEQAFPTLTIYHRGVAHEALINVLVTQGEIGRAHDVAQNFSSFVGRARQLAVVAQAYIDAGDLERARDTALDCENTVRPLRQWIDSRALIEIAVAVAEAGCTGRAAKLIDEIRLPSEHSAAAFLFVAGIQVRAKQFDGATLLIERGLQASDQCLPHTRATRWLAAARLLCAVKCFDRAREIIDGSNHLVDKADWAVTFTPNGFLVNAIAAHCVVGDFHRALELAETFEGSDFETAVINAATVLTAEGNEDAALSWRNRLDFNEPLKSLVTLIIAGELARMGHTDRALSITHRLDLAQQMTSQTLIGTRGFPDLAAAQLASDRRSEITDLIGSPQEASRKTISIWGKIANAAARQKNIELTQRMARKVEARTNELEISDTALSSAALPWLAQAYAEIGDVSAAVRIATAMPDSADGKPTALTAVACGLARGGDRVGAQLYIGHALTLSRGWTDVLAQWAAIAPEQVADITKTLITSDR